MFYTLNMLPYAGSNLQVRRVGLSSQPMAPLATTNLNLLYHSNPLTTRVFECFPSSYLFIGRQDLSLRKIHIYQSAHK